MIDSRAVIDPSAKIHESVEIGPFSVIGAGVEIGAGTVIGPHVVIEGPTSVGENNHIFQFASIGAMPQDKKFAGELTRLEIGNNNVIREFCTFNRGTTQGGGVTRVGNDNLFMAYVHLAHDCIVGNHTVFSNNASLAGHVIVDDYVILGGFAVVGQFIRLGQYSFLCGSSVVIKDIPPFVRVSDYYAKPYGLNSVGLQRHGFSSDDISSLKAAYKLLFRSDLSLDKALLEIKPLAAQSAHVQTFVEFLEGSSRPGIIR